MTKKKRKTTKKGRKIGRPSPAETVDNFQLRLTDDDRAAWERCAQASGLQLSQWARYHLARAAGGTAAIVGVEFRTAYPPHDPKHPIPPTNIAKLDSPMRDALEAIAAAIVRIHGGDSTVDRQRAPVQTDLRGLLESFLDKHADRVWAQELRAELDLFDRRPT